MHLFTECFRDDATFFIDCHNYVTKKYINGIGIFVTSQKTLKCCCLVKRATRESAEIKEKMRDSYDY